MQEACRYRLSGHRGKILELFERALQLKQITHMQKVLREGRRLSAECSSLWAALAVSLGGCKVHQESPSSYLVCVLAGPCASPQPEAAAFCCLLAKSADFDQELVRLVMPYSY